MAGPIETYRRDGKHAVHVGDVARVAANPDSPSGERGWRLARVVRFHARPGRCPIAVVTKPGQVGVRHVSADRLTRQSV